jgi:hypothetical protein
MEFINSPLNAKLSVSAFNWYGIYKLSVELYIFRFSFLIGKEIERIRKYVRLRFHKFAAFHFANPICSRKSLPNIARPPTSVRHTKRKKYQTAA